MASINKPNTFTVGATILSAEHNDNFDTIYNDYNGNISNANIAGSAAIVDSKLAQITTASKVSTSALVDNLGLIFQTGMIINWSGAVSAIPTGWVICDGNNGSPDLTDRFVIHADSDSGGTNDVGDTGGASTVTLSVGEVPALGISLAGRNANGWNLSDNFVQGSTDSGGSGTITSTTSTGGGGAHTNRDKFYALAYIYKT